MARDPKGTCGGLGDVSVVITTFNWPHALAGCLLSLLRQSVLPREIIIADDGSKDDTRRMVDSLRGLCAAEGVALRHVWHPDAGYRRAAILNRAFLEVSQPYILQMDCDCLAERHFVEDHLSIRRQGCFVAGSRVSLDPARSQRILSRLEALPEGSIEIADLSRAIMIIARGRRDLNAMRCHFLRDYLAPRYRQAQGAFYLRGCNMAFWHTDIVRINGYDTRFEGWGQEDNEIAQRLLNAGVSKRFLKFGGVLYHLYHPERPREHQEHHFALLRQSAAEGWQRAEQGMQEIVNADVNHVRGQ